MSHYRFSQFFISPLFTADATDREINAVDSGTLLWCATYITSSPGSSQPFLLVDKRCALKKTREPGDEAATNTVHTVQPCYYLHHISCNVYVMCTVGEHEIKHA